MFTGIVERQGRIVSVKKNKGVFTLNVDSAGLSRGVKTGDSIAVNGVCLTVTRKHRSVATFDVIEETLRKTNLEELKKGSKVNLERSLQLSDRIDGHLVLGHVDGVGTVIRKEREQSGSIKMWFQTRSDLLSGMIPKGAITLDGISLTLVDVLKDRFSVCLIPHTTAVTTISNRNGGDSVNVEVDFLGKYVRKFMGQLNLEQIYAEGKS